MTSSAAAFPLDAAVALDRPDTYRTMTHVIRDLASLESELALGLHEEWRRIADDDPHASLFQTPGWCMPWYRCYDGDAAPFVLVVAGDEGGLAGVVPMAVDRQTGAISFASNTTADYRDIVALPGHRERVVSELVRVYLEGSFPNPLEVGWVDPASDTLALVQKVCRQRGLPSITRTQPCWRWVPPPPAKPSAQKFLNWYKRHGTVAFEIIDTEEAWVKFRDEYYRQHSLRQIQTGRPLAFDDPRKAAMYEHLFHSNELQSHVTAFCVDGRMLAGHFGYVWRGVLSLGPPSIRLEDEQRSPAVILLAWIIQNAAQLGLAGFDLTVGECDFKERLGNRCVDVAAIEVFGSPLQYRMRMARTGAVAAAKKIVARVAGEDAWRTKVKRFAGWADYKRRRLAEMGVADSLSTGLRAAAACIYDRRTGIVYTVTPEQLRAVEPVLRPGERCEVHENRIEDLLLWNGSSPSTESALTAVARSFSRARNANRSLHTIVVDGKLAGWGYSYPPDQPAALTETPGAILEFEPQSVSLYDFRILPEFRGRKLYQALLTAILRQRFGEGAARAYITVLESNVASRAAIERVGFRAVRRNRYRRLWKTETLAAEMVGQV
jgi:CelD/BcsL family acetyltransferase involved in cellulose biosynthesis/RimJ/RimL family protein N-acetyltransferase